MIRLCRGCGQAFIPKRAFYHSCFGCWREAQLTQSMPADFEARRENARLRSELERLRALADRPRVGLDSKTLREIVQLVH